MMTSSATALLLPCWGRRSKRMDEPGTPASFDGGLSQLIRREIGTHIVRRSTRDRLINGTRHRGCRRGSIIGRVAIVLSRWATTWAIVSYLSRLLAAIMSNSRCVELSPHQVVIRLQGDLSSTEKDHNKCHQDKTAYHRSTFHFLFTSAKIVARSVAALSIQSMLI